LVFISHIVLLRNPLPNFLCGTGKVEGKFYDKNGNPTKYYYQAQKWIKAASKYKEEEDVFKEKYPMCNVDYKPEEGTRVWCSTQRF